MILKRSLLLALFLSLLLNSICGQKLNGQRWKDHLVNDLLPYWNMPSALGNPTGNFPTYRCNDGLLTNCKELDLSSVESWIINQSDSLKREFIRTRSRQTFFYGVAYHLTGNEKYLYYAQCGVNYIRQQIMESGLIYSYYSLSGNTLVYGPDSLHITAQDLAGALTGLSFYYYLTHDNDVLKDIIRVRNYIFSHYSERDGCLKATLCPDSTCSENRTDLASYLEQVNDYLLLITPLVEIKSTRDSCIAELRSFCEIIKSPLFYNLQNSMIWARTKYKSLLGTGYDDPLRKIGAAGHTDYGQTGRTYWNLFLIGKLLNDTSTCNFAFNNGTEIIHNASLPDGAWALSPFESEKRSWWLHAELDEATALFSLIDTTIYSEIAEKSFKFWFDNFVDRQNYEVYPELDRYNKPLKLPKIYHWKNAFHTGEHALFGYIASGGINNEDVDLYFAYNRNCTMKENSAKPFYFDGDIKEITFLQWNNAGHLDNDFKNSFSKARIVFSNISAGRSF
jgi:mannose/cellobiose epimerase-like protein (N-acyl-D-glucosamine 2-epimerase family)